MQKKIKDKLIQEILGYFLQAEGFSYLMYDVQTWIFERKKRDVKQNICVHDKGDSMRLYLQTNAYRQMPVFDKKIVDREKYKGDRLGFWEYKNDEEFAMILEIYKEALEDRGLQELERISEHATEIRPTPESNRYLYEHHAELFEEYRLKLGLDSGNLEVFAVMEVIKNELERLQGREFSNVLPNLIGLAAVCGETIVKSYDAKWEWRNNNETCWVEMPKLGIYMLQTVINSWDKEPNKIIDKVKERIEYNFD